MTTPAINRVELYTEDEHESRYFCRIEVKPRHWVMEVFDYPGHTLLGRAETEYPGSQLQGDALVDAIEDWAHRCVMHRTGFF